MLRKVIVATSWLLFGGLIGWLIGETLNLLMQGIAWQLGELGILRYTYKPGSYDPEFGSSIDHSALNSKILSFLKNGGEKFPVYGLTLGQITGVIYGAKIVHKM